MGISPFSKSLSLIASITLLYQYQRKQVTRVVHGDARKEVTATLDDIEVAYQRRSVWPTGV